MISLNLREFKDYQFKDVYAFIMMHNETDFEIIIERVEETGQDDNFLLFWEYHMAAYVGEKLNEIALNFEYNVPAAASKNSFKYRVTMTNMEIFCDLLWQLIQIYYKDEEVDILIDFEIAASGFFLNAYDTEIKVVTWACSRSQIAFSQNE